MKGFQKQPPEHHPHLEKNTQIRHHKQERHSLWEDAVRRGSRQATDLEEVLANHVIDKSLVSAVCEKELSNSAVRKQHPNFKKIDKKTEQTFHQRRHLGGGWTQEKSAEPCPSLGRRPLKPQGTPPLTHQRHPRLKAAPTKPHPKGESGRGAGSRSLPRGRGQGEHCCRCGDSFSRSSAVSRRPSSPGPGCEEVTIHSHTKIRTAASTTAPSRTQQESPSGGEQVKIQTGNFFFKMFLLLT